MKRSIDKLVPDTPEHNWSSTDNRPDDISVNIDDSMTDHKYANIYHNMNARKTNKYSNEYRAHRKAKEHRQPIDAFSDFFFKG